MHDIDIAILSICLSRLVLYETTQHINDIITLSSAYGSQILVFSVINTFANESPLRGRQMHML